MRFDALRVRVAAFLITVGTASAALAAPVEIDIRAYEATRERDERDSGAEGLAAGACEHGHTSAFFVEPIYGCAVAYEHALQDGRFEDALRYASTGCLNYRHAPDCRRAAQLPLKLGQRSVTVPPHFGEQIRRLAEFACLSRTPIRQIYGPEANGRECSNLARQFVLARDSEYRVLGLTAAARVYFEALYDAPFAERLLRASCEQFAHRESCERARSVRAEMQAAREAPRLGRTFTVDAGRAERARDARTQQP